VRRLRARPDEHGAVAVVVAAFCVVMFGLAALVVDLGYARDVRRQFQGTADSAALAAAQYLGAHPAATPAEVAAVVHRYARSNADVTSAEWGTCTDGTALPVVAGPGRCISYDPTRQLAQVRLPERKLPTFFSGAFGGNATISAFAQATWGSANGINCAFCVLGAADLDKGDLSVTGGDVAIDGDLTLSTGRITVTAPGEIGVAGSGLPNANLTPAGTPIGSFTDPLAGLAPPPVPATPAVAAVGPVCSEGTYTTVTACTVFLPGTYVVVGANTFTGSASPTAIGTLFYFTCDSGGVPRPCATGETGGSIEMTGTSGLTVVGASHAGATFAVIYDRHNAAPLRLRGGGATTVFGNVYAPGATMNTSGSGSLAFINSLVVVGGIESSGNPSAISDVYSGTPPNVAVRKPPSLTK
jgi:hypothetical protein